MSRIIDADHEREREGEIEREREAQKGQRKVNRAVQACWQAGQVYRHLSKTAPGNLDVGLLRLCEILKSAKLTMTPRLDLHKETGQVVPRRKKGFVLLAQGLKSLPNKIEKEASFL